MLWFITLTQNCNLKCLYCGSDENDDIEDLDPHPKELTFPIEKLGVLAEDVDPIICFYGGEPLLKMRLFKDVYKLVPQARFVLQTNAMLLDRLPTEQLCRLDACLVSIDGDASATDRNRGTGTYSKAVANAEDAKQRGYKGDMIARMTVSDGSDIYADVMHLLQVGCFDHVHWQLDVLWDSPMFARWTDFLTWRDESYNPGITKLAQEFRRALADGKVLGIAPFLGIIHTYLTGKPVSRIRCGAGSSSFNITTGGTITACPIAPELDPLGELTDDLDIHRLEDRVLIGGRCKNCEVLSECGGRCLYGNKTDWWGEEGFDAVCHTVKHLLAEVKQLIPDVKAAIEAERCTRDDFHYPKYNNSIEIIP